MRSKSTNFRNLNKILTLRTLKPLHKIVLLTIDRLCFNEKYPNQCWYGTRRLIEECGVNKRTFFDARFVLETAGFIDVVPDDNIEHQYRQGEWKFTPIDNNHYTINRDYIEQTSGFDLEIKLNEAYFKRSGCKNAPTGGCKNAPTTGCKNAPINIIRETEEEKEKNLRGGAGRPLTAGIWQQTL